MIEHVKAEEYIQHLVDIINEGAPGCCSAERCDSKYGWRLVFHDPDAFLEAWGDDKPSAGLLAMDMLMDPLNFVRTDP